MHEKVDQLFTQKTQRQAEIRQNKLPLPVLSLPLQILFIVIFGSHTVNNFKYYF